MKKEFPELFKQTSTGAVQTWKTWTEDNVIHEEYGLQNGKKQHRTDTIKEGKNIGKANETTSTEQAQAEANAKWVKKRNKEYREDIKEITEARTTSSFGGTLPMLAQKYTKCKAKVKFPCFVQPKLDGIRCTAKCEKGKVTLWFRSGKPVTTMGHIVKALDRVMKDKEEFDGELYVHNADFNKIGGCIRRDTHIKKEEAERIEYHIYDHPSIGGLNEDVPFKDRLDKFLKRDLTHPVIPVVTYIAKDEEEIMKRYAEFMERGYEGIMIRNMNSPYESGKRSYNLLKYKQFDEGEFRITGFDEGRGIYQKAIGAFILVTESGLEFGAKMCGTGVVDLMKEYFKKPELFIGKEATVKYQGLSEDGVPRFPVMKGIRFDK